jgi:hypothetical protein
VGEGRKKMTILRQGSQIHQKKKKQGERVIRDLKG